MFLAFGAVITENTSDYNETSIWNMQARLLELCIDP